MVDDPLQKLYVDNPLEREVVPEAPLSFELVSEEVEALPIETAVLKVVGVSIALVFVTMFLWIALFPAAPTTFLRWMPMFACGVTLPLIAWTLLRCSTPEITDPRIGLFLAVAAFVAAVLAGDNARVVSLVQGTLLLYAVGEVAAHWSLARWRCANPLLVDDLDAGGIRLAGAIYLKMLPASVCCGFVLFHVPWLVSTPALWLTIAGVWILAIRRSANSPLQGLRDTKYLVEQTFGYPDSIQLPPGLFRSPMLGTSLRSLPSALFVSASGVPVLIAVASMVSQKWIDFENGIIDAIVSLIGNVLLMVGLWVLLAGEISDEA